MKNLILIEENQTNEKKMYIEEHVERRKVKMCKQKITKLKKMGNNNEEKFTKVTCLKKILERA
jgi:hypothetical protein